MKRGGLGSGIVLSKRLLMLAGMVTPGNRLVDVGCDHGFLPVYLVQKGICRKALAMDVRTGPLKAAQEHIREFGLEDYIEIRMSDGLAQYDGGETDTLVMAGMGGRLMERILARGMSKAVKMKELILQPQSEISEFRSFLRNSGFRITGEDAVREDGKYYFALKAICDRSADENGDGDCRAETARLYNLFGEHLLRGMHPVLLDYLKERQAHLEALEEALGAAETEKAARRAGEIRVELEDVGRALLFFGREGQI